MEASSEEPIEYSTQVKDFQQEMLALIFSLRMGPVLRDILNEDVHQVRTHVDELKNYLETKGISVGNEFILRELDKLKYTFRYLQYDLDCLWKPGLFRSIENSFDMTDDALHSYVRSMSEIGNACTFWNFSMADKFLRDKVVLDYGCGSGFFYNLLRVYFRKYVGYDRFKILFLCNEFGDDILRDSTAELIADVVQLECLTGTFDTIWLSQVLHSKTNPMDFIRGIEKYLKSDGGTILVCGIKSGSPVSIGLNSQLRIHSGVEGMSTHLRLKDEFKTIQVDKNIVFGLHDFGDNHEVVSIEYCKR